MKIAFIGVGGIAGNYRGSLRRLQRPIAAICDINADRAESIAKEENATAYTDHQDMMHKEKPDVVFTCIPPGHTPHKSLMLQNQGLLCLLQNRSHRI